MNAKHPPEIQSALAEQERAKRAGHVARVVGNKHRLLKAGERVPKNAQFMRIAHGFGLWRSFRNGSLKHLVGAVLSEKAAEDVIIRVPLDGTNGGKS